jgi:hypothetical protein
LLPTGRDEQAHFAIKASDHIEKMITVGIQRNRCIAMTQFHDNVFIPVVGPHGATLQKWHPEDSHNGGNL